MKKMQKLQTINNKRGEIEFRKKLVDQIQTNSAHIPGQPTYEEYITILKQRIDHSRKIFKKLQEKHISLSPFLEIGAERGQRSMLLMNEFNATGVMSDISYESLESAYLLRKTFGFKKMPISICCDAYNLPFKTGSIPFIFCFQTLHHFPNPKPILLEIKRVLAPGGYFYCNEEPIKQVFNLNLWRRDYHLKWFEEILKSLGILHFVSRIGKGEVGHAILENEFSLETWEKALNVFLEADVNLIPFPFGFSIRRQKNGQSNWIKPFAINHLLLSLLGGGVEALCRKKGNVKKHHTFDIFNKLACPNCKNKPKLSREKLNKTLTCKKCDTIFEKKHDIYILFSKKEKKALYS